MRLQRAGDAELTRLKKLTVPLLKAELVKLRLDDCGSKPVLIEKLLEAFNQLCDLSQDKLGKETVDTFEIPVVADQSLNGDVKEVDLADGGKASNLNATASNDLGSKDPENLSEIHRSPAPEKSEPNALTPRPENVHGIPLNRSKLQDSVNTKTSIVNSNSDTVPPSQPDLHLNNQSESSMIEKETKYCQANDVLLVKRPLETRIEGEVDVKRVKVNLIQDTDEVSVLIKNFTRPLNIEKLKEDLRELGDFKRIWLDKYRTCCYVFLRDLKLAERIVAKFDKLSYQPGRTLESLVVDMDEALIKIGESGTNKSSTTRSNDDRRRRLIDNDKDRNLQHTLTLPSLSYSEK